MKTIVILAGLAACFLWAKPNLIKYCTQLEEKKLAAAICNLPRESLIAATEAYAHEQGHRHIETVTLLELVSAGYLRIDDLGLLQNQNVVVSLPASPQPVFIRLHLPSGYDLVELKDGSIVKLPS
jgi:hypothetical protein